MITSDVDSSPFWTGFDQPNLSQQTSQPTNNLPPEDWPSWLTTLFPDTYSGPLAPYQAEFWDWLWATNLTTQPQPYMAVWARGWAKSTNTETGAIALGTRGRRYILYVCGHQPQADDHVTNIAMHLESEIFATQYHDMSEKWVGKFGNARGWRRNRLSTKAGFTVDGIGLDVAMRGAKLGNYRPDVIIFDDIDETTDSQATIAKKIEAITTKILPAAAPNVAVIVAQNLVHRNGIVSQLVDGRADFLAHRIVSGPHKAIDNLVVEGTGKDARIIEGTPTWVVLGIAECQAKIGLFGLKAFLAECQHDIELSGQMVFDLEALRVMQDRCIDPIPQRLLPNHLQGIEGLEVYEFPQAATPYVEYTDPAEGKGRDDTASGFMAADTRRLVAVLDDTTRGPQQHAAIVCDLLEWYAHGITGYERAKGEAHALVLGARHPLGWRIYENEDNPLTPQQKARGLEPKLIPGFPMTQHSKRGLIDRLADLVDNLQVYVPSRKVIDQLKTYILTERNTTEAEPGGQDGLVIMLAGCVMLAESPGAQRVRETSGLSNVRGYTPRSRERSNIRGL